MSSVSLKEKFKSIIGIDEEEYEEEYEVEETEEVEEIEEPKILKTEPLKPVLKAVPSNLQTSNYNQNKNYNTRVVNKEKGSVTPMNKEMIENNNKVIIREPNEYSDAQDIADCLKENFPVFINLQRLEKGQAKRVVDFLSGTIYAIDGDIKRVGTNLFLCTPKTVETEGQVSLQELQLEVGE